MITETSVEKLEAMVEEYENTLRYLLDKAEEHAKLFAYRCSPEAVHKATLSDREMHIVQKEIRRAIAYALHRFHPEVALQPGPGDDSLPWHHSPKA